MSERQPHEAFLMQKPNGILSPRVLTSFDWSAIDALADECRSHDRLELPLHRAPPGGSKESNQFLYYQDDELVGIASLAPGNEIEVLGVVHPEHRRKGIGRLLLSAVADECKKRGVSDFLLVCEEASFSGCEFAKGIGAKLEFSEYLMELDWTVPAETNVHSPEIDVRLATSGDIDHIVDIQSETNNDKLQSRTIVENWLHSGACQLLVARFDEQVIGMIRVTHVGRTIWLNSFVVRKSLRGRGIGRRVLVTALRALEGENRVLLEVETDNKNALALYRSVGFCETTTYRYYRHEV